MDAMDTQSTQGPAEAQNGNESKGPEVVQDPVAPVSPPNTLSGQPLREPGEGRPPREELGGGAAVQKAARGEGLTDREHSESLQWLLKAEPDPGEQEKKVLQLNFGTSLTPDYIDWTIKPVSMAEMRRIRNGARNSRQAKRSGQIDEVRMNLQVIVAGTVDPDVRLAAEIAKDSGNGHGDPVEILNARFQSKPGYIAQIAAEIMSLSGFDDDDVQEKEMVEAAGNS